MHFHKCQDDGQQSAEEGFGGGEEEWEVKVWIMKLTQRKSASKRSCMYTYKPCFLLSQFPDTTLCHQVCPKWKDWGKKIVLRCDLSVVRSLGVLHIYMLIV